MARLIFGLLLLLTMASRGMVAGDRPVIGVLETPQCNEKAGISIRALFARSETKWISLDTEAAGRSFLSSRMEWTIVNQGKALGAVASIDPGFRTDYSWTYSRDRFLNPAPGQSLPHLPNEGDRFHGWCSTPIDRPLIVISHGSALDSSKWVSFTLNPEAKEHLFPAFKKVVGRALFCPNGSEKAVAYRYTLRNMEVLDCFKDRNNRLLVTLRLKPPKESDTCDGILDSAWDQHTFLLGKNSKYVGIGLVLVGAGDFSDAGRTELLFWHSGYDQDGYVLFSDQLNRIAEYMWGYH